MLSIAIMRARPEVDVDVQTSSSNVVTRKSHASERLEGSVGELGTLQSAVLELRHA